MPLHFVQIVFWLALSTWFGGVLFIALSAPAVIRTMREHNPILPTVLSVNLENQHGMLLANSTISGLMDRLIRVELVCAAFLLLALAAQWGILHDATNQLIPLIVRSALYVAAVVLVVYNWRVLWPRVNRYREHYITHADEPDVANAARDDFERHHRETVTLLSLELAVLLGMVLFSANVSDARQL